MEKFGLSDFAGTCTPKEERVAVARTVTIGKPRQLFLGHAHTTTNSSETAVRRVNSADESLDLF
jgi:hypothetical protein